MTGRGIYALMLGAASALVLSGCGASGQPGAAATAAPASLSPKEPGPDEAVSAGWNNPDALAQKAAAPAVAAAQAEPQPPSMPGSTEQRLDALEKEVAQMRSDLGMMMPALTRLVDAQQDLQRVLDKMDTASGDATAPAAAMAQDEPALPSQAMKAAPESPAAIAPGDAPPAPLQVSANGVADAPPSALPVPHDDIPPPAFVNAAAAPQAALMDAEEAASTALPPDDGQTSIVAAPAAETPASAHAEAAALPAEAAGAAPAAPSDTYTVDKVRFGEHAKMTRLVLDASGKVPYSYELDKSGTLMTIRLPRTQWKGTVSPAPAASPVIASYTVTPDGQGGSVVAVKMKKPVSVNWADILPPSGDGGYRLVIDMAAKA